MNVNIRKILNVNIINYSNVDNIVRGGICVWVCVFVFVGGGKTLSTLLWIIAKYFGPLF